MTRLPASLRPRTAGAWLALVAALLGAPSEAYVVPLAWCPRGGVRALVQRLHAHEMGDDFRVTWHQIQQRPRERAVVASVFDALDACPELLDDGRELHVAIWDAYHRRPAPRVEHLDVPWIRPEVSHAG